MFIFSHNFSFFCRSLWFRISNCYLYKRKWCFCFT